MSREEDLLQRALLGSHKAVEPDWGLDLADRPTVDLELARSWITAYRQLLDYDTAVLDFMRQRIEHLQPTMRREVEATNIPIMDGEIERVRQRLAFWEGRETALAGDGHRPS